MDKHVTWVYDSKQSALGLIVSNSFETTAINFLTPDSFGMQVAYMNRPKGEVIQAHIHEPVKRTLTGTQEVLYIRKGKIRVDFYEQDQTYVSSYVLQAGDLMLLNVGGHGFEIIEDVEMIEIKQGPYVEGKDKTRFIPDPNIEIVLSPESSL
jgi:hypothetical protein